MFPLFVIIEFVSHVRMDSNNVSIANTLKSYSDLGKRIWMWDYYDLEAYSTKNLLMMSRKRYPSYGLMSKVIGIEQDVSE